MKRRLFIIALAVTLMALAVSMTACGDKNVYDKLAEDGYTVKVIFDAGGAVVNETQNVTIVEVFNENDVVTTPDGKTGIKLLSPDDSARGDGTFKLAMSDGENNYFSPGWYRERTLRVDGNGQPLDAYGIPTATSGREQAYVYSGRWDFENDVVDPASLENGEMTLYAAWVPFITYEIYADNGEGDFELIKSVKKIDFTFPTWNKSSGKLTTNDMPKIDGKTFAAAYLDGQMTQLAEGMIDGDVSFVDSENGTALASTVKIYTTWMEGSWLKIFDAEQFIDEMQDDPDGQYILGADICFEDVDWQNALSDVTFTGELNGDGYALCFGESVTLDSVYDIFGVAGEDADIYSVDIVKSCE